MTKRLAGALAVGVAVGALGSSLRFAAIASSTGHAVDSSPIVAAATADPTPLATPAPGSASSSSPSSGGAPSSSPASGTSADPPVPQVLGAGTPLPIPVLSTCANPALPPAILDGKVDPGPSFLTVVKVVAPKSALKLAVVATPEDRESGLMCVTALRKHTGMIFVFPETKSWDFWMKNTLVPLDMIWVAPGGKVTTVAADVPGSTLATPDDQVARRVGTGRYVIELSGGEAAEDGIRAGTILKLPPLSARS